MEASKSKVLRWRGLMSESDHASRVAALIMLTIGSVALVATQLSYVVVGDAHMMCVLAPITAVALLYGPLAGAGVGAVAGLAELIHATRLSLDIYERYFQVPWNSVLLFMLVGLLMGVLFALVDRWRGVSGWKRPSGLAVCCALGSFFFTVFFQVSTYIVNSLVAYTIPTEIIAELTGSNETFSQILANFGLMTMLCLAADEVYRRRRLAGAERSLRETFQGWLFVVVVVAYMVVAALCYTFVSIAARGSAEITMQNHLDYLQAQLVERDRMVDAFARRTSASNTALEEIHATTSSGVATGLSLGDGVISAVAEDNTVISSNVESYVGRSFEDVVGEGLAEGFDPAIFDETRSIDWYLGSGNMGYLRATEMGYVRVAKKGSYQLMVAMPASGVFYWRGLIMAILSAAFLLVFATVYVQASILLREVVVKSFDRTNETLDRITEGDLDQVVDVHSSIEFSSLSAGINTTVGALKEAIAAEAARLDRDLLTARAIQESALPRVFPPFPEIDAFDIYASMNPAREVGGDFYDFFLVDNHTLGFLIADVSGKGIPASLFMMAAKTEIAGNIKAGMSLDIAMQTANWQLCQGNDASMFVTVWAGELNWKTGELVYVNAGHNPPLLRHNGSWQWLRERGGLAIGVLDKARYRMNSLVLEKGDEIYLYTDGVNEAFSAEWEEFGNDRLEETLAANASEHPRALIRAMRSRLARWAQGTDQSDDITMLALEYGTAPEATGSITVSARIDELDRVRGLIHGELGRRLCPITTRDELDALLGVLFANLCRHTYVDEHEPGKIRVSYIYNTSPSAMTVELANRGKEYDPFSAENIAHIESEFEGYDVVRPNIQDISYVRDGNWNIVAFRKTW